MTAPMYTSKFRAWEERASVRNKPMRTLSGPPDGLLYFPPELAPIVNHKLVQARGEAAMAELLARRLNTYLDFTTELEQHTVNPTCAAISRGRTGLTLPDAMRSDAFKIYTDEAWHAQFSDHLRRQVIRQAGLPDQQPPTPAFVARLRRIECELPLRLRQLARVLFAIISETLISAILSDIPKDPRLVQAVRRLVMDHAIDEGVHHAYFARLLQYVWPQLGSADRRLLGVCLPRVIRAFLDPDVDLLLTILHQGGFSADEAEGIVAESYPPDVVDEAVNRDAKATLRHLAVVGVFEDSLIVDHFANAGLFQYDGIAHAAG
jgi:hypothetical protein